VRELNALADVREDHELTADIPDQPIVINADGAQLKQIFWNLARNAMQAMDHASVRDASLVIEVKRASGPGVAAKGWLEFSVADVGPGIPDDVQRQLFTPFFTTKAEGMGLGLSLCRTVVEQHGGFLAFEPRLPAGTIFRFTLPVDESLI